MPPLGAGIPAALPTGQLLCSAELIDGKAIADQIRLEMKSEVEELKQKYGKVSSKERGPCSVSRHPPLQ